MKQFSGFPARMQFTPVPNLFFSNVLPEMRDVTELKVTLCIFCLLYQKKGSPRFVTFNELLSNGIVTGSLKPSGAPAVENLRASLQAAVQRGTLLHIGMEQNGVTEDIYLINAPAERQAVAKISSGEIKLTGLAFKQTPPPVETVAPPDIFTLYEENIGILTPMTADELREAEKLYPLNWIQDAVREAVRQNKRKWSYIAAILEHWSAEGKDGTHQRDSATDPDKYIKGKYGNMVRR